MKKAIKKIISKLLPKGNTKELLKRRYYSIFKSKNIVFELVNNNEKVDFKTSFDTVSVSTNEALYPIVDDFKPNFAIASYHIVNNEKTFIKIEKFFESMNYPYKTLTFRGSEIITFAGANLK